MATWYLSLTEKCSSGTAYTFILEWPDNLSPYNNIFKVTSERIDIPGNFFYGVEINFKTFLYHPELFD